MQARCRPMMVSALMLLALVGCASTADEKRQPVQINGTTVYLSSRDPFFREYQRAICSGTVCRQGLSVHLRIPNGPDFTDSITMRMPYVSQDQIYLYAGETLSFEAEEGTSGPIHLKYVDKVAHPEKTLTVRLEQRPDIADGYGMRLILSNPFGKALKFAVAEVGPGDTRSEYAVGVCPAPPQGESRKKWLYPLAETIILSLSFVPTEEAEACAP